MVIIIAGELTKTVGLLTFKGGSLGIHSLFPVPNYPSLAGNFVARQELFLLVEATVGGSWLL